jgi:hypothetical protein
MRRTHLYCGLVILGLASTTLAFDQAAYAQFLRGNQDLSGDALIAGHQPATAYFSNISADTSLAHPLYLDSIQAKLGLTAGELALLRRNGFVVSQRLSYNSFAAALGDVYNKDLPVFITTDAILHALHMSYDEILKQIELITLAGNLQSALNAMRASLPQLQTLYGSTAALQTPLNDVDVYLTMAASLLAGQKLATSYASPGLVDTLWNAVQACAFVNMRLFCYVPRDVDFSQFTVRGHYTESAALGNYFRAMMWLGRIDFLLTPTTDRPWPREAIRRMCLAASMLNELLDRAGARSLIAKNDSIITFMVGPNDDLSPAELSGVLGGLGVTSAADLLDEARFDSLQSALLRAPEAQQKILSDILYSDPLDPASVPLPVSFRLLGQRFIIDSYIFSNVVFDKVQYGGVKVERMMPDPLDAMFVLGNDDALPLLRPQLEEYHYAANLAALRYLVDAYDQSFWSQSLYSTWLQALRCLNPAAGAGAPRFMRTTAWRQEKLNTQLGSWTQLRHDNLLYAKQSYTDGLWCSYPHSYVEPCPEFYRQIGAFALAAQQRFAGVSFNRGDFYAPWRANYFARLKGVMDTLETLARKELSATAFSPEERTFLQAMLSTSGACGEPPFSGWYSNLYIDAMKDWDDGDYLVADVHTQPTDGNGALVGRVLHVGIGPKYLGVFIAPSPSADFRPTAYVGPVFSYHEKITENFERLTDEAWQAMVQHGQAPPSPDWANCFLADSAGAAMPAGRVLDGVDYSLAVRPRGATSAGDVRPALLRTSTGGIALRFGQEVAGHVRVYNGRGQVVAQAVAAPGPGGEAVFVWEGATQPAGVYVVTVGDGANRFSRQLMLAR